MTDEAGTVVWSADYLAFGTRFGEDGDGAFEQWKGFTGKEFDPETGLYYYNARWYDPELGRFISEDPARDPNNPNLYTYVGNNPLIYIDPSGYFLRSAWNWFTGLFSGDSGEGSGPAGGSAPSISTPEVSAPSIPEVTHIETSVENIKLSSFVAELKERYPGMEIEALNENKILIKTNKYNRENVLIGLLGLHLNGEIIIIERNPVTMNDMYGVNYRITVQDKLETTAASLASEGSAVGVDIKHESPTVTLNLDYTSTFDGTVDARMIITYSTFAPQNEV